MFKGFIASYYEIASKFQNGQTVILCNSNNCKNYKLLNPDLNFIYSNYSKIPSFQTLRVRKSHSHSSKIYKL